KVSFDFSRQPVAVKHDYFYVHDRAWGPAFLKIGTYLPYPVKLCLNGHEWVKQPSGATAFASRVWITASSRAPIPSRSQLPVTPSAPPTCTLFSIVGRTACRGR